MDGKSLYVFVIGNKPCYKSGELRGLGVPLLRNPSGIVERQHWIENRLLGASRRKPAPTALCDQLKLSDADRSE
jgi:hypothetical protein